ncbi:MAG: preprotein translocase subunit SecG [Lysobacteraceae bacterium]|nr:MAG: preprotein translocase subunit SecG [Xanthomonadaceae bacterium]
MLLTLVNILYVLVAAAMIILILLQRGAGAAAGSGFGAGASATVFGARGSANFLSKSTAVLATVFFLMSLGMAMYASRMASRAPEVEELGVMGALEQAGEVPAAPVEDAPAAGEVPAPAATELPKADASEGGEAPSGAAPGSNAQEPEKN